MGHIGTALVASAAALLVAPAVWAGQWSSGGGELFRDTKNPWFPKSLADVHYCVQIDEVTFGIEREAAERAIETALSYWKNELTGTPAGTTVDVGTQRFLRSGCDEATDLTFQMGVLNGVQHQYLGDPTLYAAIAVRTDYDIATRRGKGFVYVAPESGTLRPTSVDLRPDPWRAFSSRLLELVLMHELGHVFGLGHSNNYGLMDERFVELTLNRNVTRPPYETEEPQIFVFRRATNYDLGPCWGPVGPQRLRYEFFDIPQDLACSQVQIFPDRIVVQAKRIESAATWIEIGSASLDLQGASDRMTPLIFEYRPEYGGHWLQPTVVVRTRLGFYRSVRGVQREVFVELDPAQARIGGVLDGHVIPDLSMPFMRTP